MITLLLGILIILWILGYVHIPNIDINILDINLFQIFGRWITLLDVLFFAVILWLIGILPSPFRQIASVIFFLWVLSVLGIITIAGISLSNILIIALILGLILYTLRRY